MSAQALVGREHELALLDERLMAAGDRGSALVVRGDAGMGKSALLQAARRSAVDQGLATLMTALSPACTGCCDPFLALSTGSRYPSERRYRPPSVSVRRPRLTSS
jgi:predicted ATPase